MLCRATSSLGGLWPGGHVCRFARQHLAGEYTFSLLPGTACVLAAEAGALLPLNQSPTHITDRCVPASGVHEALFAVTVCCLPWPWLRFPSSIQSADYNRCFRDAPASRMAFQTVITPPAS